VEQEEPENAQNIYGEVGEAAANADISQVSICSPSTNYDEVEPG
jgi:hypothetical protein